MLKEFSTQRERTHAMFGGNLNIVRPDVKLCAVLFKQLSYKWTIVIKSPC